MGRPLVSVVVTTYNSAQFVVETLESIKRQTYENIELIVSDDGSSDDTVRVSRDWIATNGSRFNRTLVATVPENTGVSANCNRGIAASQGKWIKFIAGDDILLPDCVKDNIEYVHENQGVNILFSFVRLYRNEFSPDNYLGLVPASFPSNIMDPSFSARRQYQLLLLSDRITFTPSYFFCKEALVSVGGYDESNRQIEDYPMWLKLTDFGFRLHFMEKETVGYRRHDRALNNVDERTLFSPASVRVATFRKRYVLPRLPWDLRYSERWLMVVRDAFATSNLNRRTPITIALYKLAAVYFNPFHYLLWFRRRVLGAANNNVLYSG